MELGGQAEAAGAPGATAETEMTGPPLVAARDALIPACSPIRAAGPIIEGLAARLGEAGTTDGSTLGVGAVSSRREPTAASTDAPITRATAATRKRTRGRAVDLRARAGLGCAIGTPARKS
jgi:hypothetical protein